MKRSPRLLITILILIVLSSGTFFAIKFAKGYRPSFQKKSLKSTGLLSTTSSPKGASVFINNKLTTATDDTLNLQPNTYNVKIQKDGYIPWEKTLELKAELVTSTNARLFPSVPNLAPLTFSGAINPVPSPDGQKLSFSVNNATNNAKNGLYVINLLDHPLSIKSRAMQITRNFNQYNFSNAKITWTPDSNQIIATFIDANNIENLLLNTDSFNDAKDINDITAQLPIMLNEWNKELDLKLHQEIEKLPEFIQQIATQSAKAIYFSPDEDKLMYTATNSAIIPNKLIPQLPSSSTQDQNRNIEPNNIYIYDIEEDRNFWISEAPEYIESGSESESELDKLQNRYSSINIQPLQWYPDSRHIIIVEENKIVISEYDGTNRHNIYAGPFIKDFAYPWPNGNRLVILTSLNGMSDLPANIYSINLK